MKSYDITAVILCAGCGSRAGLSYNKILHPIDGVSVAARTAEKFSRFDRLIIVCRPEDEDALKNAIARPDAEYVAGGKTRTESVRNALNAIRHTDIVIIQDGARPFTDESTVDASIASALKYGSGIAAVNPTSALKVTDGKRLSSIDRDMAFIIQTPQTFRFDEIKSAYDTVAGDYADDSEVYERAGFAARLVSGSPDNVKLTSYRDLAGLNDAYRIGFGFDVHPFADGRKLVLCGRVFEYDKGLMGHSDADVPVHALMDALLSAAGLPDIGILFPDSDIKYSGADSIGLLKQVKNMLNSYEIINASLCIMTQKPKISPYRNEMLKNLAEALETDGSKINLSATTTEFLGIIGEGKGIAAAADVLLRLK